MYYTKASEAILAPRTNPGQCAKTSNIFHQNQNQNITLSLSPKSVGSIIDSRCPSHQRIMIPGPSSPFSTLYVDESVCIHTYHLSINKFNPPNVVPRSFAFPRACVRVQLRDPLKRPPRSPPPSIRESLLKTKDLFVLILRALRRKSQATAPSLQASKHPIRPIRPKRTYAPPNLRVRPLHVRVLVVLWHVLSRPQFEKTDLQIL